MQLQKVSKRRYHDACPIAHALELIGERWALLVVRELVFGPRRFGELAAGLSGISAKVLTERLDGLDAAGIVQRRKLPPPASVQVYELTERGVASELAMLELGRWAAHDPAHDWTQPLSAAALMLSLRALFDPARAAGLDAVIGLRIGPDGFVALVSGHGIAIQRADPDGCDAVITADARTMAAVLHAGADPAGLTVEGDRALADRFVRLFPRGLERLAPRVAASR